MNDPPSTLGRSRSSDRPRQSRRRGIVGAALVYLCIVYLVWVCYYIVEDIQAGEFNPGTPVGAMYTTVIALILFGIPTVLGAAIMLFLRPRFHWFWLALPAALVALGPGLYWWSRPSSDHRTILVQQVAQALFLGYLLFRLLRPSSRFDGSRGATRAVEEE